MSSLYVSKHSTLCYSQIIKNLYTNRVVCQPRLECQLMSTNNTCIPPNLLGLPFCRICQFSTLLHPCIVTIIVYIQLTYLCYNRNFTNKIVQSMFIIISMVTQNIQGNTHKAKAHRYTQSVPSHTFSMSKSGSSVENNTASSSINF